MNLYRYGATVVFVCARARVYLCVCMFMRADERMRTYVFVCVRMYVYVCVCTMCARAYVCM
jgi:cytochrome c oxidase subunit IV